MMLTSTENFFVRLLRGTVVSTAAIALLISLAALVFAAYAYGAPEPTADLSGEIDRFRYATDPAKLLISLFPNDSDIYRNATSTKDNVPYQFTEPSDHDPFVELNQFLDEAIHAD